jgi:hypothetical protein
MRTSTPAAQLRPPLRRLAAIAAGAILALGPFAANASSDAQLKARIEAAFAQVRSYKVTVLGSVRSLGVWQAPNSYQMTTEFAGKTVKTVIIGRDLYQYEDGKWDLSGTASNNLDVDIAGLIRTIKADPHATLTKLPDQTQDGKRVSTFGYTFKDGTEEACNYDPATYRVTRCKSDELTLLYSAYNDPSNKVAKVK